MGLKKLKTPSMTFTLWLIVGVVIYLIDKVTEKEK